MMNNKIIIEDVELGPSFHKMAVLNESGEVIESEITDRAQFCLLKLVEEYDFEEILDVGTGRQTHAKIFRALGKKVITIDPVFDADYKMDYLDFKPEKQYEAIFCSHVLEHQRNVGVFLDKLFNDLQDGGILALSVPCVVNHQISSGHSNWFNSNMLLYHLILAGFDCKDAKILVYGYNLSVILKKKSNGLKRFSFALELDDIAEFFPDDVNISDRGINGAHGNINWKTDKITYPHESSGAQKIVLQVVRDMIDKHDSDYNLALSILNSYISYIDRDAESRYLKGMVLSHLERYQEALNEFEIAHNLGFTEYWIRFQRAMTYFSMKNFVESEKEARIAQLIDSSNSGLRVFYEDVCKLI